MDEFIGEKGQFSVPEIPSEDSYLGFPDIVLRTMQSDLEAIKKAGGGLHEIQKSAIPIHIASKKEDKLPLEKTKENFFSETSKIQTTPAFQSETKTEKKTKFSFSNLPPVLKISLGIIGLIIFFLIGYFGLPKLFPPKVVQKVPVQNNPLSEPQLNNQTQNNLNQTSSISETSTTSTSSNSSLSQAFNSESLFKKPADQNFEFQIDLKTPNFKKYYYFLINDALNQTAVKTTSSFNFFTVNLKDSNNNFIQWPDFLNSFQVQLLSLDFWQSNFKPNFGVFIYKNKNGIWPGYILEIKPTALLTALQVELKNIDQNKESLSNFFINSPDFSTAEFKNSLILSREPIRILKAQSGEEFVYGIFFNKYLILSTSLNGLEEAVKRM
ncbi:MAG: hypothetical protein ACP5QN_00165 [Minisyncoccia bacterium]